MRLAARGAEAAHLFVTDQAEAGTSAPGSPGTAAPAVAHTARVSLVSCVCFSRTVSGSFGRGKCRRCGRAAVHLLGVSLRCVPSVANWGSIIGQRFLSRNQTKEILVHSVFIVNSLSLLNTAQYKLINTDWDV